MCFVCRWSNDYNSEKHKSQLKHTYEIVKKKQVNLKEVFLCNKWEMWIYGKLVMILQSRYSGTFSKKKYENNFNF